MSTSRSKLNIWNPDVKSYWLVYIWVKSGRGGLGWSPGGGFSLGRVSPVVSGQLPQNSKYITGILSSSPVDCHPFWASWVKGGSIDMSKSQRHTRSGAGCGVSQTNGAAFPYKVPELCQHEIVSGFLKKWKQCGAVQASCGCLVSHVCMDVRISVFAP